MMCAIIEDLLRLLLQHHPAGCADGPARLRHLIVQYLPRLDRLLQEHDIGEARPPLLWVRGSQLGAFRYRRA